MLPWLGGWPLKLIKVTWMVALVIRTQKSGIESEEDDDSDIESGSDEIDIIIMSD